MATIAVLGVNGFLGESVINSLLSEPFISNIKTPIRLLTTSDKKPIESSNVEYINIKDQKLDSHLTGVDALINLIGFPNGANEDIIKSAVASNVKLYIPSQFGFNMEQVHSLLPNWLHGKIEHSEKARAAGLKTIDFNTSLFYVNFGGPFVSPLVTLDSEKATILGDGKTSVNPSTLTDIGKSIASVVTSNDYSKLPNKIRIYSDNITVEDLLTKYEQDYNVKLTKEFKSDQEFLQNVVDKYNKDGFNPDDFFQYLAAILIAGEGKGTIVEGDNEKEIINPNESLFKWTKLSEFPKI
ncbi:Isoflavone reductase IRL [Wickerhamomyces ciferrii]|uniref:Isoflavone reductase IRL n=1 Tax=Wickerhamomyces ciferrii (strain ATCC 14091 / BCRC 22168 / CBS 111 / JCM 3599 / NBRC 0793 / NRRL Y-1031 F-60-10) TaxID=1206466 RepID=K0KV40_WICCF|nr:Isoflavone reductase IRL [Wickerhamomyces ciferrii]CCH47111.1 Isoflavone reductase IRL [Wickerhamomyces ciferrii]